MRVRSVLHPQAPGLGMGLAICRSIAEHHGRRIHAGNHADGNAVFEISLPGAPGSAKAPRA